VGFHRIHTNVLPRLATYQIGLDGILTHLIDSRRSDHAVPGILGNDSLTDRVRVAALARETQVVLVDELAHTNLPGSRQEKRWLDVETLLEAAASTYSLPSIFNTWKPSTTLSFRRAARTDQCVLMLSCPV
jgi:hypothetical protein